jgi:hypothetical protein
MPLPPRDGRHHGYGDYLIWPEEACYEPVDGVAHAMAPARGHPDVLGQLFAVYGLAAGAYGKPEVHEMAGALASHRFPEVVVDWAWAVPEHA